MQWSQPRVCCVVYFLLRSDEVVYVGKANNLHSRIFAHLKDKRFDSVVYFECDWRFQSDVEIVFLDHLKPRLNKYLPAQDRVDEALAHFAGQFDRDYRPNDHRQRRKPKGTPCETCSRVYPYELPRFDPGSVDPTVIRGTLDWTIVVGKRGLYLFCQECAIEGLLSRVDDWHINDQG